MKRVQELKGNIVSSPRSAPLQDLLTGSSGTGSFSQRGCMAPGTPGPACPWSPPKTCSSAALSVWDGGSSWGASPPSPRHVGLCITGGWTRLSWRSSPTLKILILFSWKRNKNGAGTRQVKQDQAPSVRPRVWGQWCLKEEPRAQEELSHPWGERGAAQSRAHSQRVRLARSSSAGH